MHKSQQVEKWCLFVNRRTENNAYEVQVQRKTGKMLTSKQHE